MWKIDTAPFFPNACLCGNGTGPFVDTGMEKPVSGRVYLCERCVRDAACTHGGWVERDHYDSAVAAMARSEQKVAELEERVEIAESPESKVIAVSEIPEVIKAVVIDMEKERAKRRPAAKTPAKKTSA